MLCFCRTWVKSFTQANCTGADDCHAAGGSTLRDTTAVRMARGPRVSTWHSARRSTTCPVMSNLFQVDTSGDPTKRLVWGHLKSSAFPTATSVHGLLSFWPKETVDAVMLNLWHDRLATAYWLAINKQLAVLGCSWEVLLMVSQKWQEEGWPTMTRAGATTTSKGVQVVPFSCAPMRRVTKLRSHLCWAPMRHLRSSLPWPLSGIFFTRMASACCRLYRCRRKYHSRLNSADPHWQANKVPSLWCSCHYVLQNHKAAGLLQDSTPCVTHVPQTAGSGSGERKQKGVQTLSLRVFVCSEHC